MFQGANSSQANAGTTVSGSHSHHGSGASGSGAGGDQPSSEMDLTPGGYGNLTDCQAVLHDPAHRYQLVLVFPRHVVVVDFVIQQVGAG